MSTKRRLGLKKRAASTEKLHQTEPVSNYCRTCLATEGLVSIFYSKVTEEKRSHDLKLVTGLVIKLNDGLSQRICLKCTEAINFTLKFRRASKKAEKTLLEMTNSKPKLKKKTRDKTDFHLDVLHQSKNIKSEIEIQIEPVAADFSYDNFGDDFQNYDYKEDDINTVVKQNRAPRKKRTPVTPATSYTCGTCHKEFRMKATYKAHMRFHTNFCVCETCGKRCRNNNQLVEHKRARHGLGRVHTCTYCEYSAATKEALTIHERRHTGERPYVCDHCAAAFHRRSNLVQHIAIHSTDTNWQCDMCPKRLKSKKFLQIHKHNAHTGKRYGYLCGVCAHRFEKPNKVRAHTRRVHGVPDDQQGPIARVQL